MGGDDPDNGMANVASGIELQAVRWRSAPPPILRTGRPQIRAERIYTRLPMRGPVIGEPCQSTHPGQLDGSLFVAGLRRGCPDPFVMLPGLLKLGIEPVHGGDGLGNPMPPVGDDQ